MRVTGTRGPGSIVGKTPDVTTSYKISRVTVAAIAVGRF
jgi:hypothetical protein